MKIIIFGATGGTGRQLVSQALERGYQVTAFVRSAQKLKLEHASLQEICGDVFNQEQIADALPGHDAVLCALGATLKNKDGVRARGTEAIVAAMQKLGMQRLICLTGLGAGDTYAWLPLHYKYIIFPLLLNRAYADHAVQEECVMHSMLNWTLVRPGNLTDEPAREAYWHGTQNPGKMINMKIARADVAHFMLDQINSKTYQKQGPVLSYTR